MSSINQQYEKNTFPYRLESIVKKIPDKLAMVQGDRKFTWKEFDDRVNRLANTLLDLGVKKDEKVAIALYNSPEWMECYYAADKIGAVPTNLSPRYVPDEIKYILDDSDAVVVVIPDDMVERLVQVRPDLEKLKHCIVVGEDVPEGMYRYEELISKYPATKPDIDYKIKNDDICYIMYTGGTTGFPKGTVWEHECRLLGLAREGIGHSSAVGSMLGGSQLPKEVLIEAGKMMPIPGMSKILSGSAPIINWFIRRQAVLRMLDRSGPAIFGILNRPTGFRITNQFLSFLVASPLYHGAAYESTLMFFSLGSPLVFLTSNSFRPKELLETIERHKASSMIIVGDAFARPIVEELEKAEGEGREYNLSSMIFIVSSGVIWSPEVKKRLHKYLPQCIMADAVGTTEVSEATAMVSTSADKEISKVKIKINPKDKRHPRRVINPTTGKDAKPGEVGELIYGGYMAKEYWKDPEKTEKTFRYLDGKRWFYVGDMGTMDEEGYFNFIGRGSSVVNTGGEKVFPEEVEEIIKLHQKVKDAAVVGVPDERWGQAVTAVIQVRDGEELSTDEIIDYCRGKMAGYKKPKHVVFTDSFPRTLSGKVEKIKLKEIATEMLGFKET
ncbi:MAG: AMP-binding protein [Halobacteriota archaeon]|nr:AMP-binding protein [Halobacteriota archaeon]